MPGLIPDGNLAVDIREALDIGLGSRFTKQNLNSLSYLLSNHSGVRDITGLEHATNLERLFLRYNEISDITPLAKLTHLEHLDLSGNEISDITPLAKLTHLRTLYLDDNEISDITPLAKLTHLQRLYLSGNEISDITPLAKLTHLRTLYLDDNEISDITPLAKLTKLKQLRLAGNKISDTTPLQLFQQDPNLFVDIDLETPKIEGPWLWMIVPTEQKADAKAALEKDYLAAATKGVVTEQQIATNGATPGDTVGDMVWTLGKIAPLGSNNITHTVNTIGLGHGGSVINNHVAYASISLDSPRKQNTRMYVGSNESVKVWLNGVLVHKKPVYRDRPADDYQYTFRVTLKQGKNIFLIAVYNTSGAWSGFFGFKNDVVYSVSTTPIIHVGAPQRPPMYWIDTNAGTLHRLIGNEVEDLLPNVQNATSLAMDPAVGRLYWTEKTGKRAGKIKRANLDGSNIKLIKDLTSVPYDIAVDTANNKLYLTNAWGKVQRLNIDGSNIQPNLITGLKSPKHLTLDVTGGKVYWTEQVGSTTGKIQRANLDGTNVELLKELTSVPHGLAIDPANNKLYLTNAYGKIQCLNIDGSNIQPNLITDLDAPKSLVVDSAGGKVYWTEQGSIRRANRNGNNIQNVVTGLGTVDRITLGFAPTPGLIAAAPTKTDPDQTALLANYPNPFNPETWIPYQLAEPSDVKITIYNTHEVVVRQLGLGHQPAGIYTNRSRAAYWDGRNNQGERVASGIYFYQLQTDNISSLRKMLILK